MLFALLLALLACQSPPAKQEATTSVLQDSTLEEELNMEVGSDDSIPADLFSPKQEFRSFNGGLILPDDVVTPHGNRIRYLISNDTCCNNNVYLEWGNKQFRNIEKVDLPLGYSNSMIPRYVEESSRYLVMESPAISGMPTTGWNLWLLPLVSGQHAEFCTIVFAEAYDLKSMTIVREVLKNRTDRYIMEAYNLLTKESKPIVTSSPIISISPSWAIDSISITPKTIVISITTENDQEILVVPNDIH